METIVNKVYNGKLVVNNIVIKDSNNWSKNVKYIIITDTNLNNTVVYDTIKSKEYFININTFKYNISLVPSSYTLILYPTIDYTIEEKLIGYTLNKVNYFKTGGTLSFISDSDWAIVDSNTGVLKTLPNASGTQRTAKIQMLISYATYSTTKIFTITLN